MKQFNRDNTLKSVVPNRPGIYTFYDRNRRLLYVGHSSALRHRIQSYREIDDRSEHPTKAALRPKIKYFNYEAMPLNRARSAEKKIKPRAPYNKL